MYAFQFIISKAKCIYRNIGFQIMKKFVCTSARRNIGRNLNWRPRDNCLQCARLSPPSYSESNSLTGRIQRSGTRYSGEATVQRQRVAAQRAAQQGVLALHGQRGLRDRGLGRLRARGATRSDLPWAPTPGKKIVLTGDILLFVPQSRDTDRDCILKEHPDRDVCAAPDRPHFPGWQRERNCVPRLLALWPEQAARVQRVLRLQGNHLQPAAILNETNCKYKMSRPEATLHLY